MSKTITALLAALETSVATDNLIEKASSANVGSFTTESFSPEQQELNVANNELVINSFDKTMEALSRSDDFTTESFTSAQIKAGRLAAGFAVGGALKDIDVDGANLKASGYPIISGEDLGFAAGPGFTTEAFDGTSAANIYTFSVGLAVMSAKQDPAMELMFPTAPFSPTQAGVILTTEVISLFSNFLSNDDRSDKVKLAKTGISNIYNDPTPFVTEGNKLIPNFENGSVSSLMVAESAYTNLDRGVPILTAGLVFGKTIPIVGISQSNVDLTKGFADNTEILSPALELARLYVTFDGNEPGSKFGLWTDVRGGMNTRFTPTVVGNVDNDLQLTSVVNFSFSTDQLNVTGGHSLTLGHIINIEAVVNGAGNIESRDIIAYASSIKIKSIQNPTGDILPEDDAIYVAILNAVTEFKLEAYEVDGFTTNLTGSRDGFNITVDTEGIAYAVAPVMGFQLQKVFGTNAPISKAADLLERQITQSRLLLSIRGMTVLTNLIKKVESNAAAGIVNGNGIIAGIGSYKLNPTFPVETVDLLKIDSLTGTGRLQDIRSTLINKLRATANLVASSSNYKKEFQDKYPGQKMVLTFVTSSAIRDLYTDEPGVFSLSADFDCIIETTLDSRIGNKFVGSFGIMESRDVPNELNFGNNHYAPDVVGERIKQTATGGTIKVMQIHPRTLHVVNLPILIVFNFTNINEVFEKVTQNHKIIT